MDSNQLQKLPSFGELILYMHKDLAILAVLAHFGSLKHREETMSALYEIEYLKSKQESMIMLGNDAIREELIASLRKEGFIGL